MKRQVIIFTHDILFVNALAEEAKDIGSGKVSFTACTISVGPNDKTPGYVNRTLFPLEHYEKKSKELAEEYLAEAKQLQGTEQREKLVLGCGALRAAYENFIQRRLFGDVVGRWRENIRATAISNIYHDQGINEAVVKRYEILSRYEQGHSHSPEFHERPLDCGVLEEEIQKYRQIEKDYNRGRAAFEKERSKQKKDVFS